MKLKNLNLDSNLISESARREITTEPDWWKKLGHNSRQAYLKKHPNSQMAKFVRKQKEKRLKAQKAKQENAPSTKVDKPLNKFPDRTPANDDNIPVEHEPKKRFADRVKDSIKKFLDARRTRAKYSNAQLKIAAEKMTRQEIARRTEENLPKVKHTMAESQSKFKSNLKSVASYISQAISPSKKEGLGTWLKARLEGNTSDKSGEETGSLVAVNVITAALGLGALVAVTAGVAPIAGALAGAFFGFNDYRRSLPKKVRTELENKSNTEPEEEFNDEDLDLDLDSNEDTKAELADNDLDLNIGAGLRPDDSEVQPEEPKPESSFDTQTQAQSAPENLESKSNDEDEIDNDPVQYLVEELTLWLGEQDQDLIARKVAELMAIQEMAKERWKPSIQNLTDEELDTILQPKSAAQLQSNSSEEPEDDYEKEYVAGEESEVKRLTLRCSKECSRLPNNERWRYNIRFGDNIVGNIRCVVKNTGGKFSRNWICVLEDGFNESVYRSGKPIRNDEPYTLVKNGKIYLINPIKQTFDEVWAWAKLNIDKEYL